MLVGVQGLVLQSGDQFVEQGGVVGVGGSAEGVARPDLQGRGWTVGPELKREDFYLLVLAVAVVEQDLLELVESGEVGE